MKNKLILLASGAIGAVLVLALLAAAPANYYGNPASPDQYGNTVLGAIWQASSTTVSNLVFGYGAGANVTAGTNNILIGSAGVANDFEQIRIGTVGTHTNTTIAGVINGNGGGLTNLAAAGVAAGGGIITNTNSMTIVGAAGFGSTGTNTITGTFTAWTNTNSFAVVVDFTNGVTNLTISNSVPFLLFSKGSNLYTYSRHLGPGYVFTNTSANAVISEE